MSPLDGQVRIVFNGEICNFRDLCAEQWETTVNKRPIEDRFSLSQMIECCRALYQQLFTVLRATA